MFKFITNRIQAFNRQRQLKAFHDEIRSRQLWLNSLDLSAKHIEGLIARIEDAGGLLAVWDCDYMSDEYKAYDHLVAILDNLTGKPNYDYYLVKVRMRLPEFTY